MADNMLSPGAGLDISDPVTALELANPPPGELTKGLKLGAKRAGEELSRTAAVVARSAGFHDIAGFLDQKATEYDQESQRPDLQPRIPRVEDIEGLGDIPSYVASIVGQQLPQLGLQVVSALATRGIAPRLGVAKGAATVAGAAAPSFIQNFGDNMSEQAQVGVYEPDLAAGAAGLQAALDTVLFGVIAQRIGGRAVAPEVIKKARARIASEIIKGAGIEGITEGLQEGIGVLARTAVDPDYANRRDEIMSRILNAVVGGGILGAGFGGATGLVPDHALARPGVEPATPELGRPVPELGGAPAGAAVPFPEINPEPFPVLDRTVPELLPQITLPDVVPPAPVAPPAIPPAPGRRLRSATEVAEARVDQGTAFRAFPTELDRFRVSTPEPTIIGEQPARASPEAALDELRRIEIDHKRSAGELLTSDEIRFLRYAERGRAQPVVVEQRAPRLRSGPEAEATAQNFVTDRIDEATSAVLSRIVADKGISQGTATNIRRMIRNRMSEVFAQTGEQRGPQFDSLVRDVIAKTPLRDDVNQFIQDLNAEVAARPEKNVLPSGAREFVPSNAPIPGAERTGVPVSGVTVERGAPVRRQPVQRLLPVRNQQLELIGGNERAADAVAQQIATKRGRSVNAVKQEQLTLFSKGALTLDFPKIAAHHAKYGGSSTDPISGAQLAGTKGYAVSGADRELILPGPLSADQIAEYAHANADMLSQPGAVLGTWLNTDTGQNHLDVSVIANTLEDALVIARASNQLAVWDMRLGVNIPVGDPVLNLAQVYNSQVGRAPRMPVNYVEVDQATMTELANAYATAVDDPANPETQAAYQAMNAEVEAQYNLAAQTIKIEAWPGVDQPYVNSAEMRKDVFENKHLWVWNGGEPNALMTQEQNFKFRAIHDIYGHAATGFEFGPRGELNAFRAHAQMFSDQALRAFATESAGQNAYVNFHPDNLGKPLAQRAFPEQKATLVPETIWRKLLNEPADAQAKVYHNFQATLAAKGKEVTDYLNKIIGGREGLELRLQLQGTQYAGKYTLSEQKSVIELALNAKDVLSTGAHEGFHFLESEVLSAAEQQVVQREFAPGQPLYERLIEQARLYDQSNNTNISAEIAENENEARAYGFEFWRRGQLEAKGVLARAFDTIHQLLTRVRNFIDGLGFASTTDIFEAIDRGDYSTKRRLKVEALGLKDDWYSAVESDILPGAERTFYKEKPTSQASGRPWWVQNGNHVRGMRSTLRALALEGQIGRTWHRRSAEAALVFAHGNREAAARVAALFANYSPRSRVGFDARSAFIAILRHSQGLPIEGTGAAFPTRMDAQAQLILDGKYDVTGIKRESFFWNMMKYIDPERFPEANQRATIDMWMAMAFGYDRINLRENEYIYADAEVKRLARELGWATDETQAAIWIAIKGRMDPEPMRAYIRDQAERRGWLEAGGGKEGRGELVVKKDKTREYYDFYRRAALNLDPNSSILRAEIAKANYAYDNALRDLATGKINLAGTKGQVSVEEARFLDQNLQAVKEQIVPLPGTDFRGLRTPKDTGTMDLFSRAAMIDLEDAMARGEFDKVSALRAVNDLVTVAQPAESKLGRLMGLPADARYKTGDILDSFKRTIYRWISSGEYRASKSVGYANVHNVLTYFDQRKKRLISQAVDGKLSQWRSAASADLDVVSKALVDRTMAGYEEGSDGYLALQRSLTEDQRRLFKQATEMIASELDAEFAADTQVYERLLGRESPEFQEWLENRATQVSELKRTGYFPERRYGDHAVNVYVNTPNGAKVTIAFETFDTASQARLRIAGTKGQPGLKEMLAPYGSVGVEYAYKYKPALDGSVSFQRVMELLQSQGVQVTQAERERLAKALIAADSTRRNRIFRRENVPGASADGLRVLSEFAVGNASKIAYSEFGDAINRARAGERVTVGFDQTGHPNIAVDRTVNMWGQDNPEESGFFRRLADEKIGFVLNPDNNRLASGIRALASMQFLGGSIASAGVQLTSLPMNSVPWLTQHTSYADAHAKVFGGLSTVMRNGAIFLQREPANILTDLRALDKPMPGIDEVPGLRQALIVAFQDGTTLDTDIYEIMGLARGQILSLPRTVQKAADLWMYPFRKAEQTNRWSTFIAAYRIGLNKGITGRALYDFARKAVDSTQFRYDVVNRPSLANSPVGALIMTFKSYPIYMTEMILGVARHDRKAALVLLGTLWFFAGLEGMPFFEDGEDLVDTIAQRVFKSPFNSQRFLRNMISDAAEVVPFIPNASILMRGTVNFLSDANVAGRVGLGNMIPGTRMFAADADYKRTAEEIVGPGLSAVTGWGKFAGSLSRGDLGQAMRNAPFLAVQNLAKGYTAFSRGYYADGRGQKLVDAGPLGSFMAGVGFTPESVRHAYETANIDRETNAFYTEFKTNLVQDLVKAVRDGDRDKVQEVVELTRKWNTHHPELPILLSASSIRRAVMLAGLPLNQRTVAMLPKRLRAGSATFEEEK